MLTEWTAADGLQLAEQNWTPRAASGVLVFVHGIVEHSGRYAEFAQRLCRENIAVSALDLRGHGRSAGERVWVARFARYEEDLERFVARIRERHPGKPLFVFGHSMGGAIVARWAITRRPAIGGAILSAPAIEIAVRLFPLDHAVMSLVGGLFPRWRLVPVRAGRLSRDPAVRADFLADPAVFHGRVPLGTLNEVARAARWLSRNAASADFPFLLLHGTADRLTAARGSEKFYRAAAAKDKTLKLYQGAAHDLLHEPERETVAGDVIAWIKARL